MAHLARRRSLASSFRVSLVLLAFAIAALFSLAGRTSTLKKPSAAKYTRLTFAKDGIVETTIFCPPTNRSPTMEQAPPPSRPYQLINFFSFNNEFDILEARFQEYQHVVNTFVIFESTLAFSNLTKPLRLAPELCSTRYAPFHDRILHVVLDPSLRKPEDDAWAWEAVHRDKMVSTFV